MSPKRLWNLLSEPRNVTLLMLLIYIHIGVGGWLARTSPPEALLGEWGEPVTELWGWAMLICSALGLMGAFSGWYWIERAGAWAGITAMLMFGTTLFYLHGQDDARIWGVSSTVAIACALFLGTRIARTWGVRVDPARGRGVSGLVRYWRGTLAEMIGARPSERVSIKG